MPYVPPIYTKICAFDKCQCEFQTYYENAKYCCGRHRESAHKQRSRSRESLRTGNYEGSQHIPGLVPANAETIARRARKEMNSPQARALRARIAAIAVKRGEKELSDIVDENMDIYELIMAEMQKVEITQMGAIGSPTDISVQDEAEAVLHDLGYGKSAEVIQHPAAEPKPDPLTAPVPPPETED